MFLGGFIPNCTNEKSYLGQQYLGIGLIAVEVAEQVAATVNVLLRKGGIHQPLKGFKLLLCAIDHSADPTQLGASNHIGVDQTVASGVERIQQLEFQSCGETCEEHQYLRILYQPTHRVVVGIGDKSDIAVRSKRVFDPFGRVASCYNKMDIGALAEDVVAEIVDSFDVFWHREVGVVECVGAVGGRGIAGLRNDGVVLMRCGHKEHLGATHIAEMDGISLSDGKNDIGAHQHSFVTSQTPGFFGIIEPSQGVAFGSGKTGIIFVFDIVGSHQQRSVVESFEQRAAVQALHQDRGIVAPQVGKQIGIVARFNNIGPLRQCADEACASMIVGDAGAEAVQLVGGLTAIGETMEMHFDAKVVQGLEPIKDIDHTAIVGRIWHVKGYYV